MKNNKRCALLIAMKINGTKLMEKKYVLTHHYVMKDKEQLKMIVINALINVTL